MTTATGNAYDDGAERRGWLIGHFIEPETSPLHSTDVEIKWGTHTAGEERHEWTVAEEEVRTTMVMLLRGHFAVRLSDGDQELKREGDFVVFGPGTPHSWQAFDDSVVLTVRWPSVVGTGGAPSAGPAQELAAVADGALGTRSKAPAGVLRRFKDGRVVTTDEMYDLLTNSTFAPRKGVDPERADALRRLQDKARSMSRDEWADRFGQDSE